MRRLARPNDGFTVVELLIALVVIGILLIPVLGIVTGYYFDTLRSMRVAEMQAELRASTQTISEEMKLSAGIIPQNTLSDANAPSGGWQTNNANQILVAQFPALRQDGTIILDTPNKPYYNEVVYYLKDGNAYMRTIRNPSASGNVTQTTCPSALATSSCRADRVLLQNVLDMSFTLFDRSGNTVSNPATSYSIEQRFSVSMSMANTGVTLDDKVTSYFRNKLGG